LEKGASFFHIPFDDIELGLLDSRWNGSRWASGRRWRSKREHKKVDQKEKANKKRP
jgi:hypothetical protein